MRCFPQKARILPQRIAQDQSSMRLRRGPQVPFQLAQSESFRNPRYHIVISRPTPCGSPLSPSPAPYTPALGTPASHLLTNTPQYARPLSRARLAQTLDIPVYVCYIARTIHCLAAHPRIVTISLPFRYHSHTPTACAIPPSAID